MSRNTTDKNGAASRGYASSSAGASGPASSSSTARPPARRGPSGAWSRLKPAVIDPLDVYGLPSKGETRLHDARNQEAFYAKIVERYMKFCATSGGHEGLEEAFASLNVKDKSPLADLRTSGTSSSSSSSSASTKADSQAMTIGSTAHAGNITTTKTITNTTQPSDDNPSTSSTTTRPPLSNRFSNTDRPNDMPTILHAMRKLREGILGSRRTDAFAQRAYKFIIHASILSGHWETYQPALLYLLEKIHPATPLSHPELIEFASYRVLDLACRQYELGEAYAVKWKYGVKERKVVGVLRALVHDDWVFFWRARRAVDGYVRGIMEFGVERMRLHALKCLGRGYFSAERGFVERCADENWEELIKMGVGWQLMESGSVVIRKPRAK